MNEKCPKCGSELIPEFERIFSCESSIEGDGAFVESWHCLANQRDALKARVEALEKAGDALLECMHGDEGKPFSDWITEAHDAELNWLKAKGHA